MRWPGAQQVCAELRDRGFAAVPAEIFEVVPPPLRNPPPEIAALPPAERPDLSNRNGNARPTESERVLRNRKATPMLDPDPCSAVRTGAQRYSRPDLLPLLRFDALSGEVLSGGSCKPYGLSGITSLSSGS